MAENEYILLRRFSTNGDAEAFAQIIKQHAPMVYGVCLRILANRERAADVVQDTFFQLVRDAAEITGSLPNWLHKVATHRAIDLVRSDSQRKQREIKYAANPGNIDSEDNKAAWREISVVIDEELDNLDDQTKEILILRFFQGKTMTDIAENIGVSQPTVSRWTEAGIELLRQKLKSRGIIVPAAVFIILLNENIVQATPDSIMKELGKLAIAGSKASIGAKIASSISTGITVKMKLIAGMMVVLAGASLTVVFSFIANGENKPASIWELVTQSQEKQTQENQPQEKQIEPDNNTNATETENKTADITVDELLDKYAKAVAKLKTSYLYKAEDFSKSEVSIRNTTFKEGVIYENYGELELRSDSKSFYSCHKQWGDNPTKGEIKKEEVAYNINLWNGESRFQYATNSDPLRSRLLILRKNYIDTQPGLEEKLHGICDAQVGGPLRGSFDGGGMDIDQELKHADKITVRSEKENINRSDCYVIDAKTKRSEFVVWIDPEHGYNAAQVKIKRKSANPNAPDKFVDIGDTSELDLTNVVFKEIDGIWVPVEGDYSLSYKFSNGDHFTENHHHKITEYIINPDHEEMKSFDPKRFVINGAQVRLKGINNCTWQWQDGKIIDSYGYEVNLSSLKHGTLIGKTLPSLAEFNIALNPDVFKNNKLLICFFDYSKESSKNYILSLNEKIESLLNEDIYLIFIQTGTIEEQVLADWIRRNEIVPPVGTKQIELSELEQYWAIQSLPWLIITDKNHIVTADGFGIAELDEKIKD